MSLPLQSPSSLPRIRLHEDDVLQPITAPPLGRSPLSPPSSHFPHISEESEFISSLNSGHFRSSTSTPEYLEFNFSDELDLNPPLHRQLTMPYKAESPDTEATTDSDKETKDKKPSKYDLNSPFAPFSKDDTTATITPSRSGSVHMTSRSRGSASTPVKESASASPRSSIKPQSKLTREIRSLNNGAIDLDKGTSTECDDTAEDDLADDDDEQASTERTLRKRTVQQTHPFKFDKHNHNAQKAGRTATTKKIEKEVQQEVKGTWQDKGHVSRSSAAQNKRKASTSSKQGAHSKRRSSSSVSKTASPEADDHDHESVFDPAKTTFIVRLDGFASAAAAVSLKECNQVDGLMDFIRENWEWRYNGAVFSYAIASFSWLNDTANIILRPGTKTNFDRVVSEAERAPAWAAGEHCDIEVTVYLQ